tara:strand:+ start:6251 stop:6613 length:363 start_codon:yes stop_codon:yes gene_type:complete
MTNKSSPRSEKGTKLRELIAMLREEELGKRENPNFLDFFLNPSKFGGDLYTFYNPHKLQMRLDKDDIFREFYDRQVTTPKGEVTSRPLDSIELIQRQLERGVEPELPELQPLVEALKGRI